MREVQKQQMDLGAVGIADIDLDLKSRDDIPAILLGLQHLYSNQETRTALFALLEESILVRVPTGAWDVRGWRCGAFWLWVS